jgi:hypothetical protein
MFVQLSLIVALALQISAHPVQWGFDQNPPGLYQGDMKLTPEQEKEMKTDPNTVVINTSRHWRMNLEGFVEVPFIFDPEAGYSKLSQY